MWKKLKKRWLKANVLYYRAMMDSLVDEQSKEYKKLKKKHDETIERIIK